MAGIWVGIDVAKGSFVAWVAGTTKPLGTFDNDKSGFEELFRLLGEAEGVRLVLEPTGGYEAPLAHFALQRGWSVSLVNPVRVRSWAKGEGRRAKTDRQDARMLADYGAQKKPPSWDPLPREVSELESLLRRRSDLEGMLQAERNRRESLNWKPDVAEEVPGSVDRLARAIEEELGRIEKAIKELLAQHGHLETKARLLDSVPGIGAKTVLPVLVFLERFESLTKGEGDAKGVAAYAGLDPQPYQSGTSVSKHPIISRMGNREIRRQIVMAALGGVRGNNPLRIFYQRLVDRDKPKLLALVAAARKMLVWAWAVHRHQLPFSPDHLCPNQQLAPCTN